MLEQAESPRSSYDVPQPDTPPLAFYVIRHRDVTGEATGTPRTGFIAEGIQYSDGSCSVRWGGKTPCTHVWGSVLDFLAVHGHGDNTSVRWINGEPGTEWLDQLAAIHRAGTVDS